MTTSSANSEDNNNLKDQNTGAHQSAIKFFNRVKLRFRNDEYAYKSFLNAVKKNHKSVAAILVDHQDSLEEFIKFVPYSEDVSSTNLDHDKETSFGVDSEDLVDQETSFGVDSEDLEEKVYRKGFSLFGKVKDYLCDADEYLKFLSDFHDYNHEKIGVTECFAKSPHLMAEFKQLLDQCQNIGIYKRQKHETEKVKRNNRYNENKSNDGSKEHDKSMNFKWEDDLCELDVFLNRVSSTIKRMEEILSESLKCEIDLTTPFNAKDHFSSIHLSCIERLYDDHGLDVIDLLNKNPIIALPIILRRFMEKEKEGQEFRREFYSFWTRIQTC